jgi:hypothetical protein
VADGAEQRIRDCIARGIYDARPFMLAHSGGVMDVMRVDQVLAWEDAPDFYRSECYEIADSVHARMLLAQAEDADASAEPERMVA